ncbi:MAG: hypothetical protein WAW90_03265 [Minisyncoccia bacterium]
MRPEIDARHPIKLGDIRKVDLWTHTKQGDGGVEGLLIHSHLQDVGKLGACLNVEDLLTIKEGGLDSFEDFFLSRIPERHLEPRGITAYGSMIATKMGEVFVPYLHLSRRGDTKRLGIDWRSLLLTFGPSLPAGIVSGEN